MPLTETQRQHAEEAFAVGIRYLTERNKLTTELQSGVGLWACQIVCCNSYPADRPKDERDNYVWVAMRNRTRKAEIAESRHMARFVPIADDLIGNGAGVPEGLIRQAEIERAAKDVAGIKPSNFSRKAWWIQNARRKRLARERDAADCGV